MCSEQDITVEAPEIDQYQSEDQSTQKLKNFITKAILASIMDK